MIVLEVVPSDAGPVIVAAARSNGALLYLQKGWCQSEADSRGISYTPYIHAMFDLVMQAQAMRILMIGCGGGTLATMLARASRTVTVVDVNHAAIDIARRYFGLDEEVACYIADGLTWLRRFAEVFDCIIVDAFHGDEIPAHLCSAAFFVEVRQHLGENGLVLMNAIEDNDDSDCARAILSGMTKAGLDVRVLEEARAVDRNLVVLGGAVEGLRTPTMRMPPASPNDQLWWALHSMSFRGPVERRRAGCAL